MKVLCVYKRDGDWHHEKGTTKVQDSVMIEVQSSKEIMTVWERKVLLEKNCELVMFLPEGGKPNF